MDSHRPCCRSSSVYAGGMLERGKITDIIGRGRDLVCAQMPEMSARVEAIRTSGARVCVGQWWQVGG